MVSIHFRTRLLAVVLALSAAVVCAADTPQRLIGYPQVLVVTTQGEFVIELEPRRAPLTARHFLDLVLADHYAGTVFHRVIPNFVVQGGSVDRNYEQKGEVPTIFNESGNGLSNQRATIAMARTDDPHSASASFYINLADNSRLDPRRDRWGYTVFGQVVEGMEVIDAIAALPTGPAGPFVEDVPSLPVVVQSMTLLSDEEIAARAQAALEAAEEALKALEEDL